MAEGYKAVCVEIEKVIGGPVSIFQVFRWARARQDRLPLLFRPIPGSKRKKVLADLDAVRAWAQRVLVAQPLQ